MIVWTVWEIIDDFPECGGGAYLDRIFQNKKDAEKYCEQMTEETKEDTEKNNSYYIEKWPVC